MSKPIVCSCGAMMLPNCGHCMPPVVATWLKRFKEERSQYKGALQEIRLLIDKYYNGLVYDGPELVKEIERVVMASALATENRISKDERG